MAGMLPGVESARRRRFHRSCLDNSGGDGGYGGGRSTRRSSFCLYVSNCSELIVGSPSSMERNSIRKGVFDDAKLDAAASEAKKRLDHKLQTHWKSEIKRSKGKEKSSSAEGRLK
ncbi:hypothetical protein ABFX02_11G038500 [Erythranthe guttata]